MFDLPGLKTRYTELERWNGGKWVNLWTEVPARSGSDGKKDEHGDEEVKAEASGVIPHSTSEMPTMVEGEAEAAKESGDAQAQAAEARKQASASLRKQREREHTHPSSCSRPARHFIVLPHAHNALTGTAAAGIHFGSREKWEKVVIENVEDEVAAHTALFNRSQNINYDELVEKVGRLIVQWRQ